MLDFSKIYSILLKIKTSKVPKDYIEDTDLPTIRPLHAAKVQHLYFDLSNAYKGAGRLINKSKAKVVLNSHTHSKEAVIAKQAAKVINTKERGLATPKKARRNIKATAAAIQGNVANLRAQIIELEYKHVNIKSKSKEKTKLKGDLTKKMNAKRAEIKALEATLL
ncbi:hypothetical protein G6011_00964 [Alternaria panax]|uniref:Uncharacterized protein n=1 Tax=Alternaria panax TaxID=48097 RepID=A0AAD4IJ90_9PLEO|nr:hypothetical protein G6011_00964 [Alternaria panax]